MLQQDSSGDKKFFSLQASTMKIAAVSLVKDECDIIELFVRINLRIVDHLFIIDNGSSDATLQIICNIRDEGLPVTLMHDSSIDFQQDTIVTDALNRIALLGEFDWFVCLDADEFISGNRDDFCQELESVCREHYARLRWKTFIPLSSDYFSFDNPIWQNFHSRIRETKQYFKVAIPASLVLSSRVSMGNHYLVDLSGKKRPFVILDTTIDHVPVRSSAQIVSKAILGSHTFSLKLNRRDNEGFHWDFMAAIARENSYSLNISQLQEIAFTYSQAECEDFCREVDKSVRIGCEDDRMMYKELSTINLCARLDNSLQQLCGTLGQKAVVCYDVRQLNDEIGALRAELDEKNSEIQSVYATIAGKFIRFCKALKR